MRWISNLFSRHWTKLHYLVVFLLGLVLLSPDFGVSTATSEVVLRGLYYPFFLAHNSLEDLLLVNAENQRLRLELMDSKVRLTMLEEAGRENFRLRSILGFEPPIGYSLLPAEVTLTTGIRLPTSAVINRGIIDGVSVGEPIISEEGLVGKIVSVSSTFSTVQLLTDPTSRVAVRVSESREMGIAKYIMLKGLIVDNIPTRGDVKPGDQILSSGLGGVYPAGLVVGTVIAVDRPENDPFCEVRLAPAADFNSLDELFVLRAKSR